MVSDNVLTFTDSNGKLMALKTDITLSIIRGSNRFTGKKTKVFYNENVYLSDKDSRSFKETRQTGIECFGAIDDNDIEEVILLAVKSLQAVSCGGRLMISNLTLIVKRVLIRSLRRLARNVRK